MSALSCFAFAFLWIVLLTGFAFACTLACAWLGTRGAGGGR